MAETIIMRGAYAITDPRLGPAGVIPEGAVAITDGTIVETGPFATIAPEIPRSSGGRRRHPALDARSGRRS